MREVSIPALSMTGNPTDDEIAAISAAYAFLLSRVRPQAQKRLVAWPSARRAQDRSDAVAQGNRSWVYSHRMLAR